jgi:predicted enzyme related to lactoylglutathione lyase
MPEYEAGVPVWVDVSSPDVEKTNAFYSGLFGWEANVGGPEVGGYTIYKLDGKMVAGAGPTMSPDQHPAWSTYVQTDNANATAEAVTVAGGQVIAPPMQVMEQGTMAVFQDPTGAFVSAWQPGVHKGAEFVNDVGGFCWNELYTRDMAKSIEFYRDAFGWTSEVTDMGGGEYTIFKVGDRTVAGGMDMSKMEMLADVPPHWLVYFTVSNTDEAIEKIKSLGGSVMAGPMPTPMGPFAVIGDPVGAVFAVIQFKNNG